MKQIKDFSEEEKLKKLLFIAKSELQTETNKNVGKIKMLCQFMGKILQNQLKRLTRSCYRERK